MLCKFALASSGYPLTLEIEIGQAAHVPREARICQLCHGEVETEDHDVCRCPVYYEIQEKYHCLFREPLSKVNVIPNSEVPEFRHWRHHVDEFTGSDIGTFTSNGAGFEVAHKMGVILLLHLAGSGHSVHPSSAGRI